MTIQAAIYTRSTTDHAGLSALISTRCYQKDNVPQNPTTPFITFERISAPRASAMGSDTGDVRARYQISAYSADKAEAKTVAKQVRLAFQRFRGTVSSTEIKATFIDTDDEFFEPDTKFYQVTNDVIINYAE